MMFFTIVTLCALFVKETLATTLQPNNPTFAFSADRSTSQLCAASLIHSDILLTAASCRDVFLKGGAYVGGTRLDGSDGHYHEVEWEAVHASYVEGHSDHNLMLVKLKTPSGKLVQVINTDATSPMDGATLHVLGFNRESPTTLFSPVQTNTVVFKRDYAACASHVDEMSEGTDTLDDSLVFCTSTFATCHGHEGSPVVDQRGHLVGMVAGGTECDPRIPMLNIRATAFGHFMYQGVCAMSNQPLASCPQRPLEPPPAIEAEDGAASAAMGESSMDAGIGRRRFQEQDFAETMDETVEGAFVDESYAAAGYVDETIYTTTTAVNEIDDADEVETVVVGGYVDETIDPITTEEDEGDADETDTGLVIVEVIDRTTGWDEGDADVAAEQSVPMGTVEGEEEGIVMGDSYMVVAVLDADDQVTTHLETDDDMYITIDDEEEARNGDDEFAENDNNGTDDGSIYIGSDHFGSNGSDDGSIYIGSDDGSSIGTEDGSIYIGTDDGSSIGTYGDEGIISSEDDGPTRKRFLRGFVLRG